MSKQRTLAVVTGASSGIGRALAVEFAANGQTHTQGRTRAMAREL
jgi:NAD(P)-dependent dehydrogenase (short-subunit alcohol dehydrogenase family)